jgi:hypothetical protein
MNTEARDRRVPAMRDLDATARWWRLLIVLACSWPASVEPLAAQLEPLGLTTEGAQWFVNADPTPPANEDEWFSQALAAGDFNGDGADDLATGVPGDAAGGYQAGSVVVRYGSRLAGGLLPGTPGIVLRKEAGTAEPGEQFGWALAAGDFNGDSFDDLAVAIPHQAFELYQRGAVRVYYGASEGLSDESYEVVAVSTIGGSECSTFGAFGAALAAGNFDADPYDDLAIGVSWGCEPSGVHGGSVYVAHGGADGLLPFVGYRISQDSYGIYDEAEESDGFGESLAAGDFDGDGFGDLAIGVPSENEGSGAVEILMGSQWGLLFANSVFWLPGALGEVPQEYSHLASTLAAGDFDGDGHDDLAVGTPGMDVGPYVSSGVVDIAYGAGDPWWFDLGRTDHLNQGSIYGNVAHEGVQEYFGRAIAAGDLDGYGRDDLAIGHPRDSWAGNDLGAVTIVMGDVPPLGSSSRHHLVAIGWEGVPGDASQAHQGMGSALTMGDFDGSGRVDLAIGVPGYSEGDDLYTDLGAEVVLYGERKLFSDGFETGATVRWSARTQ